jgi:ubiquinone/menaquinone biosynthesis C-methylase UbiE
LETKPHGAGKSSFDLIDRTVLIGALALRGDTVLMDLGCGRGSYALALAGVIAPPGCVLALDLWREGVDELHRTAAAKGLDQIAAAVADAARELPVPDGTIDLCLMGTVFHDFVLGGIHATVLEEVHRVLRPAGRLAVIEFVERNGPPGPPRSVRLSPHKLDHLVRPAGFDSGAALALGPHTYLKCFVRQGGPPSTR